MCSKPEGGFTDDNARVIIKRFGIARPNFLVQNIEIFVKVIVVLVYRWRDLFLDNSSVSLISFKKSLEQSKEDDP